MPFTTTTELRTRLGQEVGDTSSTSDTLTRYVNLLDEAHKKIVGGGGELNTNANGEPLHPVLFPWALEQNPIIVNTEVPIEGTAAVTLASTSVTLSATVSTSLAGWFIRFNNNPKLYRVSAHTGGTAAVTLDAAYADDTDSATSYTAMKLDYTFGDGSTNKILITADHIRCFYAPYQISVVDHGELQNSFPLGLRNVGYPKQASIRRLSSGQVIVQLSAVPSTVERLELHYVKVPTTLDTSSNNPIVPEEDRDILVLLAAFYHLQKNADVRAATYFQMAKARFEAMKAKAVQFTNANDLNFAEVSPFQTEIGEDGPKIVTTNSIRFLT